MRTCQRLNFPYSQQPKLHCQKCGRRCRSPHKNGKHRRVKSEQRLFPKDFSPYSFITPTNDNHSQNQLISENIHRRRSSKKSDEKSILIDQLIQVQQLDETRCSSRSYSYEVDDDCTTDNDQISKDTTNRPNSDKLQRVQQMIYLRENTNNLTYREHHFPNEYIILKRLEEKNNLINQNRCQVDQYLCPLQLQYQTMSMLIQNTPVRSFTYPKKDPYHVQTPLKHCPFSPHTSDDTANTIPLGNDRSLSTSVETKDTITDQTLLKPNTNFTTTDSIDSLTHISPCYDYKQTQQYSQNATQSYFNSDHLPKTRQQSSEFDTAVIIDVIKCPPLSTTQADLIHQSSVPNNWNHVPPLSNNGQYIPVLWNMPFLNTNPSMHYEQYPQTRLLPYSQNSNYPQQQQMSIDTTFHSPIDNESHPNNSLETTWFSPNFQKPNDRNYLSSSSAPVPIIAIPTEQIFESQKSLSLTNSDITTTNTNSEDRNQSIRYTQTLNKIKQILNILQKRLLNQSNCKNEVFNQPLNISRPTTPIIPLHMTPMANKIDQSISSLMTTDSLLSIISIPTTYSVSSTLPISSQDISAFPNNKLTVNVDKEISHMQLDSLDSNYSSNRTKSQRKFRNFAKNINTNQQTSEEDEPKRSFNYSRVRSRRSTSHHISVRYMSPSFMFVLQLLLVTCLINRMVMYYFFGNVPVDTMNSQSVTPISSAFISNTEQTVRSTNQEIVTDFLSLLFQFI